MPPQRGQPTYFYHNDLVMLDEVQTITNNTRKNVYLTSAQTWSYPSRISVLDTKISIEKNSTTAETLEAQITP